jgi:hypothetical protein
MKSIVHSFMIADNFNSSGARSALPMGVAPEAIVELYLFKYRLKVSSSATIIFDLHKIFPTFCFSIGCATSSPDGSSPRGYDGVPKISMLQNP